MQEDFSDEPRHFLDGYFTQHFAAEERPDPKTHMQEDFSEERQQLHQRIGELQIQVAKMTVRLTDGGLNVLSLRAAEMIEDQFAQHHDGGRTQRLAKVQLIVREALREIATGKKAWDAWQPSSCGPEPTKAEGA